jgi:predicted transcriptional regulator
VESQTRRIVTIGESRVPTSGASRGVITLRRVVELLACTVICGEDLLEREVAACGASDMMSDVLAFGRPGLLLLTGLKSTQSVRTADIAELSGIVYVRGKRPDADAVALAEEKGCPLMMTKLMMFEACGRLYAAGLRGIKDEEP